PNARQFTCCSLADKAAGYGLPGQEIDGTSLQDCLRSLKTAVQRARTGGGPQLIVAQLLRLCGHGEHDDAAYIDPGLKGTATGRDCLKAAEAMLVRAGLADPGTLVAWRNHAIQQVEETVAQVQRESAPDPYQE